MDLDEAGKEALRQQQDEWQLSMDSIAVFAQSPGTHVRELFDGLLDLVRRPDEEHMDRSREKDALDSCDGDLFSLCTPTQNK